MMSPMASTRRFLADKMSSEPADGSPTSRKPPKLWPDAAAGKVESVKVWKMEVSLFVFSNTRCVMGLTKFERPLQQYVFQHGGATSITARLYCCCCSYSPRLFSSSFQYETCFLLSYYLVLLSRAARNMRYGTSTTNEYIRSIRSNTSMSTPDERALLISEAKSHRQRAPKIPRIPARVRYVHATEPPSLDEANVFS